MDYGDGFAEKNLRRIIQFAQVFPGEQIVVSLIRHLSWTHFLALIPLEKPLQRDSYAEMYRIERRSVRTLREEDLIPPDLIFRDPYFLDFLGLKGAFLEKDLEAAILRDIEGFIMELGLGFTFVARQKRIIVDGDDFYIDLLFFHRDLRRLVAIELKLDKFRPEHKGQMELYLRWLDRYERKAGEESPLGIIMCAGRNAEQVELLALDQSGIHVAEYLTVLPPREILRQKLNHLFTKRKVLYSIRSMRDFSSSTFEMPSPILFSF